ncbi:hypothetical protein PINS_up001780 [Pythium insidiosum]|nr:hypothetical protein PINS_up001780 [Pythium insidiosum]
MSDLASVRVVLADAVQAALRSSGTGDVKHIQTGISASLDVLVQADDVEAQREAIAALQRLLQPNIATLHEAFASSKSIAARVNPVLKLLLQALTALTDKTVVRLEAVEGVVSLIKDVCVNSMSSADVVAMFEFLRVSKTPARSLILRMLRALILDNSVPRAIFVLDGPHAGIFSPPAQVLFSKKGYTLSMGIKLESDAIMIPLFNFRGQNGQGLSACFEGSNIVIKYHGVNGALSMVTAQFGEWRDRMMKEWVHLCIVHVKKLVFKAKITIFLNGTNAFTGALSYPDPLSMVGGQNCIGVIPSIPPLQGKLWGPTLFGQALGDNEVQKLHWQSHWKNDLNSIAAENTGMSDKSKFIFCYDARSCDTESRTCYDVSGNDCHGWLEPGTKPYITQGLREAVDAVGGSACFLLLLLDQIPEMADFHPKSEFLSEEVADLLAFVGAGLQASVACRSQFVRLRGVSVIGFVVQAVAPKYLTPVVLESITAVINAVLNGSDAEHSVDCICTLLFENDNWFLSPYETQVKLLGEVLPRFLHIVEDFRAREWRRLIASGIPSSMSSFGLVGSPANFLLQSLEVPHRRIDVRFLCNLLVEVYRVPQCGLMDGDEKEGMTRKETMLLRKLVIDNLIDRLLFTVQADDDMSQWSQLFTHIWERCARIDRDSFERDGNGLEIVEILAYLKRLQTADTGHNPTRQIMNTAINKLFKGTLAFWWCAMKVSIPEVRLEALRLFESYCLDKVVLKRKDILMLIASMQADPICLQSADVLTDLIIGRRYEPVGGSSVPASGVPPVCESSRSINVARLEFLPSVLFGLGSQADLQVQARLLLEVRLLITAKNIGDEVREHIRSWPPWLSRLRALSRAATESRLCRAPSEEPPAETDGFTSEINHACAVLSAEASPLSAKLDAIRTIGISKSTIAGDFLLSIFQSSHQPPVVLRMIAMTIEEVFPSRCAGLVSSTANQVLVDVLVYAIMGVRNGWIHFLEFYFAHFRSPSELCDIAIRVLEVLSLRAAGVSASPIQREHTDFMWQNLSQVASLVTLFPILGAEMKTHLGEDVVLSSDLNQLLCRRVLQVWTIVLPRIHLVDWDQVKTQLVHSASFGVEMSVEEKEIYSNVIAEAPHARFLACRSLIRLLNCGSGGLGDKLGEVRLILESLKLLSVPRRASITQISMQGQPYMHNQQTFVADSCAFFGQQRCIDMEIPKEAIHLTVLHGLHQALGREVAESMILNTALGIVELMVKVSATALQIHEAGSTSAVTDEVVKFLQIVSSTEVGVFDDITQLHELHHLWQMQWESIGTSQVGVAVVDREASHLLSPFLKRWLFHVSHNVDEFNPFLIQRDLSVHGKLLAREMEEYDRVWKELDEEVRAINPSTVDSRREVCERSSKLKQDAERFAGSVHKLILQTSRAPYQSKEEFSSTDTSMAASESTEAAVKECEPLLWKVTSRENAHRMRLKLKSVRESYRLRTLSCEWGGESSCLDDDLRGLAKAGPKRMRSARDATRGQWTGDSDRNWRSEAGSDYSDFLADAQMRAAIIKSCPSVGDQDEDSIGSDISENDIIDELDAQLMDDEVVTSDSAQVQDMNTATTISNSSPTEVRSDCTPDVASGLPEPTKSSIPSVSDSIQSKSPKSGSLSPLGSYVGFGMSVLNAVGGVAEIVQKAAKDARDAVEFGMDSLYTARDALTDEAQALAAEASTIIDPTKRASNTSAIHSDLTAPRSNTPPLFDDAKPAPTSIPISVDREQRRHLDQNLESQSGHSRHDVNAHRLSREQLSFAACLVRHMNIVAGTVVLSDSYLYFIADRVIDEHDNILAERMKDFPVSPTWAFLFKKRRWRIDDIAGIHRRRYLLKPHALEIFISSTRKNYFFSMTHDTLLRLHEALMARRPLLLRRDPTMRRLRHPGSIFRNSSMCMRWVHHEISTFEYLMWLNTVAGRTYNDLTQYPVFPWIIADYESSTLDLSSAATFRDLSKPIGALEPTRLKFFLDRYHAFDDADIPKFMYGTHYSNIGVVLYYLIRLEPFTSYALSVQGGKFDHADRLFHSVAETWHNCLHDFNDLKELTPEWFYLPEFLKNCNRLDLGERQNGVQLGDVVLPPWASSAEDFIMQNYMALESEYVSAHIHEWIDLVFGSSQRGPAAVTANNVFFYLTYEGLVDIDSITDPVTKSSMRAQIAHFGQTPTQVLRDPHPSRISSRRLMNDSDQQVVEVKDQALLNSPLTMLSLPHESPIVLVHLVPGSSSMLCIDSRGLLSAHRYGGKSVKIHNTPFMNDISTNANKATGMFKSHSVAAMQSSALGNKPTGDHPAHDFIEVVDRRSRRVIAEKHFHLEEFRSPANSVAFINAGAAYCTVGHHDFSARFFSTTDGALLYRLLQHTSVVGCVATSAGGTLLGLGSSDGTISVWRVASIASTLLDTIKLFRGARSQAKPVHASDYAADQVLLGHSEQVTCLALSNDLGVCVSGSVGNACLIHDLSDGSILRQLEIPGNATPGVTTLALSPLGHIVLQSLGNGTPMLYSFHLNGTLMAKVSLGDKPMRALSVCSRYNYVIASNADHAVSFSAHALQDRRVLLDRSVYGEIASHALSPNETHVVLGVGVGKVVSIALAPAH